MKKTALILGLIFVLLNSVSVLAQTIAHEGSIDPYFQISKVNSHVISVSEEQVPVEENLFTEAPALEFFEMNVDPMAIADIAFKIWDIIKDGKPVVNVQYKNVSALPNIAKGRWEPLVGWQSERTIDFGIATENLYGVTTVDLEYKVKLRYGGSVNGKGQYIASARVIPTKVDVKWGYNLDVNVEVPTVLNLASATNPLAAINMDVTYKISTILRSYSESNSYELHGDGLMMADGKVVYAASSR